MKEDDGPDMNGIVSLMSHEETAYILRKMYEQNVANMNDASQFSQKTNELIETNKHVSITLHAIHSFYNKIQCTLFTQVMKMICVMILISVEKRDRKLAGNASLCVFEIKRHRCPRRFCITSSKYCPPRIF